VNSDMYRQTTRIRELLTSVNVSILKKLALVKEYTDIAPSPIGPIYEPIWDSNTWVLLKESRISPHGFLELIIALVFLGVPFAPLFVSLFLASIVNSLTKIPILSIIVGVASFISTWFLGYLMISKDRLAKIKIRGTVVTILPYFDGWSNEERRIIEDLSIHLQRIGYNIIIKREEMKK